MGERSLQAVKTIKGHDRSDPLTSQVKSTGAGSRRHLQPLHVKRELTALSLVEIDYQSMVWRRISTC